MKYWNTKVIDNEWLSIYCPVMEKKLSFGEKRKIFEELKEIEAKIKSSNLEGWVGHTDLKNPHIMVMFTKLKAKPYAIDLTNNVIWFKKELSCAEM